MVVIDEGTLASGSDVIAGRTEHRLKHGLEPLYTTSHLHQVHRLPEHVHVQVDHGRAWDERVCREDDVALDGGPSVDERVEEGPFDVARELPLVQVEGFPQLRVLQHGAYRLLQRRRCLLQVRQVSPHERAHLVDLLVLSDTSTYLLFIFIYYLFYIL